MGPLDLVKLLPLMDRTIGRPEISIGLIDGPVMLNLPHFAGDEIREIPGRLKGTCGRAGAVACSHGTFITGMLAARRGSFAPAICPGCTILLRPIFSDFAEATNGSRNIPSATSEELAEAIVDTVDAGARLVNLSSALVQFSPRGERMLEEALNYTTSRSVIVIAAAGNQGAVGSSAIIRHPWVIPVAACNVHGRPLSDSNLAGSIGRCGLSAPGDGITSLGVDGKTKTFSGTSAAAPFVTGAIALLWSEFPSATASQIKLAATQARRVRRGSIAPPLLDAWAAYESIASSWTRKVS